MEFSEKDRKQFSEMGIGVDEVLAQIRHFEDGFPFLPVVAPAILEKGIISLSAKDQEYYQSFYDTQNGTRLKFVPASGAATRMFKSLFELRDHLQKGEPIDWNNKEMKAAKDFFACLSSYPFFEDMKAKDSAINWQKIEEKDYLPILNILFEKEGLNYACLPKALLKFHYYPEGSRTALEEHLTEAAMYSVNSDAVARLHFTISPEHQADFQEQLKKVVPNFEKRFGIKFDITFSEQKKSTDTVAVDGKNKLFRNSDDSVLFRPAGHGALLENLNDLEADLIFVKNIDNVVPERLLPEVVKWKKILGGFFFHLRNLQYGYVEKLKKEQYMPSDLIEISGFIEHNFCIVVPDGLTENEITEFLLKKLDRPMRVCGMVKNEGEPGGGPFLCKTKDRSISLQIAESAQLDSSNTDVKKIIANSTHFNPVDLLLSVKNSEGIKYNLLNYRDASTGFISIKSKDGKELKAQELPGLWNGAMNEWNTVFVDVPLYTFNPVKVIYDLQRSQHKM